MKATTIREFTKCPDHFHPAFVNAMVKGEDATFEPAFSNSGESAGQIIPWKKMRPIYTNRMR
jgi:hypothetical protein